jgi:DHA3 family macrolide efflux protein-like MFS transporter
MKNWKKNIMIFITGQTISLFGSVLVQYAITWYITLKTQSGSMMMISILCGFVPQIFLSPFSGVWADRYDRKKLIIFADSAIALVSILAGIIFFLNYREIWILFVVSVFRSLGQAVHSPAVSAAFPQMVPRENLMKVQGLSTGIQSATMIIAPIIAGAMLSFTSIELMFSVDFLTALLAVLSIFFLVKIPKVKRSGDTVKIDYMADIKLGIKYIKEHAFLVPFFVLCSAVWFFIAPVAFLSPLQVVRQFGEEIWRLSAVEIAFSIGMTVGGVLVATFGGFKNRMVTMLVALALLSTMTIGLGVAGNFWLYLGILMVQGISIPFYNTPATVMLQEKVDPAYMGRVFSVMGMLSSSIMPLAMLFFGPLGDVVDLRWIFIGSGAILVLVGVAVLMNKKFIAVGLPDKPVQVQSISEPEQA